MKKTLFCIITTLLMLLLSFCAFADVIWEPQANRFYDEHSDEIGALGRSYTSTSDAALYDAPGDSLQTDYIKSGTEMQVSSIWTDTDSKKWGYVQTPIEGWTPMDNLTVVYDYISFEEEHKEEIVESNESLEISENTRIVDYPGVEQAQTVQDTFGDLDLKELSGSKKYVDSQGNSWYYCRYCYGKKNFWFTNDKITAVVKTETTDTVEAPADENSTDVKTVALILVAVIAVGMAVLIPVVMHKKKS